MPRYQIEDSETGRIMVVEGDAPPSEQDAFELFKSVSSPAASPGYNASDIKLDPYQQSYMDWQKQTGGVGEYRTGMEPGTELTEAIPEIMAKAGHAIGTAAEIPGTLIMKAGDIPTRIANIGKPDFLKAQTMEERSRGGQPIINFPRSEGEGVGAGLQNLAASVAEGFVGRPQAAFTLPLLGGGGTVARTAAGAFGSSALMSIPEQVQVAAQVLSNPSATAAEKTEAVGNPVVSGALGALLMKHATRGKADASQVPEATEVYGDVRPQPGQVAREVPAEVSRQGVQPRPEAVAQEGKVSLRTLDRIDRDIESAGNDAAAVERLRAERKEALDSLNEDLNEAQYLDQERAAIDNPVEVVDALESGGRDPFSGRQIATVTPDGRILINKPEWNMWLGSIEPGRRQGAIRSLLAEEANHDLFRKISTGAERAAFWDNMSAAEQALWRKYYAGTWTKAGANRVVGSDLTSEMMGFEAFNQFQMRLKGMTPREIADAVGSERWTQPMLRSSAMMIYRARASVGKGGTKASQAQQALLDRLESNIDIALTAAGADPAAIRRMKDDAQQELFTTGITKPGSPEASSAFARMQQVADGDPRVIKKNDDVLFKQAQEDAQRGPMAIRRYEERSKAETDRLKERIDRLQKQIDLSDLRSDWEGKAVWEDRKRRAERDLFIQEEMLKRLRERDQFDEGAGQNYGPMAVRRERHRAGEQPEMFGAMTAKGQPGAEKVAAEERVSASEFVEPVSPAKLQADAVDFILTTPQMKRVRDFKMLPEEVQNREISREVLKRHPDWKDLPKDKQDEAWSQAANKIGGGARQVAVEGTLGPSFDSFVESMGAKYGTMRKGQLIELWQDAVWSALTKATPEQLEQLRKGLELEGIKAEGVVRRGGLGTKEIAQAKPSGSIESLSRKAKELRRLAARAPTEEQVRKDPDFFSLADRPMASKESLQAQAKTLAEMAKIGRQQGLTEQQYRSRVMSYVGQELIAQAQELKADLKRDITPEDLSPTFQSTEGIYTRVLAGEISSPEVLKRVLTDGARVMGEPVSVTRRLTVLLDRKTGEVDMVSAYPEPAKKSRDPSKRTAGEDIMVVDPVSAHVQRRSRPLSELLNRYEPIYSVLLEEPVQNFSKHYKNLADYQAAFGKQARDFSRRTNEDLGVIGEGDVTQFKRSIDKEAQERGEGDGLPELESQALEQMFGPPMDPSANVRSPSPVGDAGPGMISRGLTRQPVVPQELRSLLQRILDDDLNPAQDIHSLVADLARKAADDQIRPSDYPVISALTKMFRRAQRDNPDTPMEVLNERVSNEINQLYRESETHSEFIQKAMVRYGQAPGVSGPAPGQPLPGRPEIQRVEPAVRDLQWGDRPARVRPPTAVEGLPPGTGMPMTEGRPGPARPVEMAEPGVIERVSRESEEAPYVPDSGPLVPKHPTARPVSPILATSRPQFLMKRGEGGILGPQTGTFPAAIRRTSSASELRKALVDHAEFVWDSIRSPNWIKPQAINVEMDHLVPRLPNNVNEALTRATGIERIPLIGRIWGPRGKIRGPVDRVILGHSVKRNMGKSLSAVNGKIIRDVRSQLGEVFGTDKLDELGAYTDVKANIDPKTGKPFSLHPSDVFDGWQRDRIAQKNFEKWQEINRDKKAKKKKPIELNQPVIRYEMTPEQNKMLETLLEYVKDATDYLESRKLKLEGEDLQMGLPGIEGAKIYNLPRVALYKRGQEGFTQEARRRIGGSYQLGREPLYKTEELGARTTVYEPDIVNRVVVLMDRVYKAVADADLANDPILQGLTPDQARIQLADQYRAPLIGGDMTLKNIEQMAHEGRMGIEAPVGDHPAFSGKVYPADIATKLEKSFGGQSHDLVRRAGELSKLQKGLMLTADLAQYLIQGGPLAARNPVMWGRATAQSLKALNDPNVLGKMLRDPEFKAATVDFIQNGGTLGHLQDFMAGAQKGELATRIPGVRQVVTRSGQAFGTFFDMAKVQMWSAMRKNLPKEQWPEMVRSIENMVLSSSLESAGLHPARIVAEHILLMASSYYRAGFQLVAGAAEGAYQLARGRGSQHRAQVESLRTVGQFMAASHLLMYGLYKSAGMDDKEIAKRMNPGNDGWLKYPVKVGNRTVEVGPGGLLLNMLEMMGRIKKASPKDFISGGPENPLMFWINTKMGPAPRLGMDLLTGRNYAGRKTGLPGSVGEKMVPLSLSSLARAAASHNRPAAGLEAAATFGGLRAGVRSPQTDVMSIVRDHLRESDSPKDQRELERREAIMDREESDYRALRLALLRDDYETAREEYAKLVRIKGNSQQSPIEMIDRAMKPTTRTVSGLSKERERALRANLTAAEKKKFAEAFRERVEMYEKFKKLRAQVRSSQ